MIFKIIGIIGTLFSVLWTLANITTLISMNIHDEILFGLSIISLLFSIALIAIGDCVSNIQKIRDIAEIEYFAKHKKR